MQRRCHWFFKPSSTQAVSFIIRSLSGLACLSVSLASAADKRRFPHPQREPIQRNLETLEYFITLCVAAVFSH